MAEEPERRFLLKDGFDPALVAHESDTLAQSYLRDTGAWIIRVRRWEGEHGAEAHYLTLKRPLTDVTNREYEPPISAEMYEDILNDTGVEVVKTRYSIRHAGRIWEVDVFHDERVRPRMIAEVELPHKDADLEIPPWVSEEVTGDRWYSNAAIAQRLEDAGREDRQ